MRPRCSRTARPVPRCHGSSPGTAISRSPRPGEGWRSRSSGAATASSTWPTSRRGARPRHVESGREDVEPAWSPDGRSSRGRAARSPNHDLYRIRIDRGASAGHGGPADDREPTWSPDGRRMAFASNAQGAFDLWAVAAPAASPSSCSTRAARRGRRTGIRGERLAYTGIVGGAADVWVTGVDGSTKRVTVSPGYDGRPDWSPDGRRLAFLRGRGGTLQPWLARPAGAARCSSSGCLVAHGSSMGTLRGELAPANGAPPRPRPAPAERPAVELGRWPAPARLHVGHGQSRHRACLAPGPAAHDGEAMSWNSSSRTRAGASRPCAVSACCGTSVTLLIVTGTSTTSCATSSARSTAARSSATARPGSASSIGGASRGARGRPRVAPRFVGDCAALQPDALRVEEGSSVGYTDRYPAFFHGQDLDLTGVRGGHLRPRPAREPRATTPRARLCEQRGVGARPGVLAVGSRATTASRRPPHLRGERTV